MRDTIHMANTLTTYTGGYARALSHVGSHAM